MRRIIAIDPGATGAIAVYYAALNMIAALKMPEGMTAVCDALSVFGAQDCAYMEKTGGYVPGNAGPGAVKFARHCGNLESAIYCCKIPLREVAPGVWMKWLGVPHFDGTKPEQKKQRKNWIKEQMARRYPQIKVTLVNADALGLLTYAMEKELKGQP